MAQAYADNHDLTDKYKFPNEELKAILDPRTYGFTEADLDKTYFIDLPSSGAILGKKKDWVLRDLIEAYKNAYCKKIGVEFMHIFDRERQCWIRQQFENI
jgi:2-oxoglutarate dehydrogenase E1 component